MRKPLTQDPPPIRRWRVGLILLIFLCLGFIVSYAGRLVKQAELQAEVTQWEARIAKANQNRLVLEAERAHVMSDAYVQEKARNELGMAQDGDSIVVVIPGTPTPEAPVIVQPGSSAKLFKQSNWEQWMLLFVPRTTTVP